MRKQVIGILLTCFVSNSAIAEEKSFGQKVYEEYAPKAISDAITLDLPTMATLAAFGVAPQTIIFGYTMGAIAGQFVRYSCKDNYSGGEASPLCGALAGATKYGTRGYLTGGASIPIDMIRGAIDIANYEYRRPTIIENFQNNNTLAVGNIVYQNEYFNEAVKYGINFARNAEPSFDYFDTFVVSSLLNFFILNVQVPYGDTLTYGISEIFKFCAEGLSCAAYGAGNIAKGQKPPVGTKTEDL